MHRFFLTDRPLTVDRPVDISTLAHQLATVLRLEPGAEILLLDGTGRGFLTRIQHLDRRRGLGLVLDSFPIHTEPASAVTLFQCTLKQDRFEWVLQKGTELGIRRFVPVVSRRSVVRPVEAVARKGDRWAAIVREAAEQSGRGRLPEMGSPVNLEQALRQGEGLRLMAWEGSTDVDTPSLLAAVRRVEPPAALSLLIGPEGGFERGEADLAAAGGWQQVRLGPRILRAETAAIAAVTLVLGHLGDLGSGLGAP